MKKFVSVLALVLALLLTMTTFVACKPTTDPEDPTKPVTAAQGVDTEKHVITIGNTAATTGAFAAIGVPFNYGLEAHLWNYETNTDGYKDADGNKYTFNFIHYDDEFDASKGVPLTEKLVEEDEVFALVGHFGSNTVAATVDYIEEKEIPMVYGVCGVPGLYKTEKNIMTVQPIYNTEGKTMLASAVAPTEGKMGLGATKVGVIATTDEAGSAMKAGIVEEQAVLGLTTNTDIFYFDVDAAATDYSAAVGGLKSKGCDVVIIAANQVPFAKIAQQFVTSDYDNVSVITSYVAANQATQAALGTSGFITETRKSYAGTWLNTGATPTETKGWTDFAEFVKTITLYDIEKGNDLIPLNDETLGAYISLCFGAEDWAKNGVSANFLNSFAMAGYVCGNTFTQGLDRVSGKTLTWDAYITAMESAPIDIKMGLTIDYADGKREGIAALALMEYEVSNAYAGTLFRDLTDLPVIEGAIK